jgi:Reverse transcriptase (RNA-dependent DNA polymerase)
MPHLESELSRVAGSQIFSTFDLIHGYWQLELSESSRYCQSFITPDGVYTTTRLLHGASNAVSHMQSSIQGILGDLSADMLACLDGLLLYSRDERALIANLHRFFTICRVFNLKLHPGKCSLYATEAKWCGRLISVAGARFDPRCSQALRDIPIPLRGADLQQFGCGLNWMRSALPHFLLSYPRCTIYWSSCMPGPTAAVRRWRPPRYQFLTWGGLRYTLPHSAYERKRSRTQWC